MLELLRKYKKTLSAILLGAAACLLAIIAIAAPSQSINSSVVSEQLISNQIRIATYQNQAESVLLAEGDKLKAIDFKRFGTILTGNEIFPKPVETSASGAIGAVLSGDRLIVRGDFTALTAPLRDYATDPLVPPNPNVTSGVHIHRGAANQNGPFQYPLTVEASANGLKGRVMGEFTLNEEQIQALNSGSLYVDLHTKAFRAGELRGVLKS